MTTTRLARYTMIAATLAAAFTIQSAHAADKVVRTVQLPTVVVVAKRVPVVTLDRVVIVAKRATPATVATLQHASRFPRV